MHASWGKVNENGKVWSGLMGKIAEGLSGSLHLWQANW